MSEWVDFYESYLASRVEAEGFVNSCEEQEPPNNKAKIIMHQGQRLVSLAQEIPKLRPNRESLQVFFLVVCAEAVSKLDADSTSGGSKAAVVRFFKEFVPADQQLTLANGVRRRQHTDERRTSGSEGTDWMNPASGEERAQRQLADAVDVLYAVRNSVAHEGNYWDFSLRSGDVRMLSIVEGWVVNSNITISSLCSVVAHGCIEVARRNL